MNRLIPSSGRLLTRGRSLFIYGPPGNGKTVMSQAIRNLLDDEIAMPHAIDGLDERWIRCRRPLGTVGGELTLDPMELNPSPSGFYRAPLQAVANCGILVIDDVGRQRCSPTDLLSRWIVPFENRVDYLALETGQMFELPFAALVVATNLHPSELVDEAFLRRIHAKVCANGPHHPTPESLDHARAVYFVDDLPVGPARL